jgi:flagellar biosynthesis regulator FlaF
MHHALQHIDPALAGTTMKTILICLSAFAVNSAVAQTPSAALVRQLPPQSTAIKSVLVPVPREIFDTLDKFAHLNWRAVQRPELAEQRPRGDQEAVALLLGAVIAEGFVAVEAQDTAEVKSVGRAVLRLARGLGVEKAALRRSRSIVERAEQGDWLKVRKEWDGLLPDVQQGMMALQSEQLAQLVSLGGWLRSAQAVAALLLQNYSSQSAELLRQPALLDHFDKQLAEMKNKMRTNPVVMRMRDGIRKVQRALAGDAPISPEKVKEISTISAGLLEGIHR